MTVRLERKKLTRDNTCVYLLQHCLISPLFFNELLLLELLLLKLLLLLSLVVNDEKG